MQLTDQQTEAVFLHDRSVVVTAGAGSGKTGVLVERFLAVLAARPEWPLSSVVAITFTDKAAREMRSRVRREVTRRSQVDDAAARAFWLRHLAALDSARIGTIHALCAMLLRANAAPLGLDPGFAVLEETDARLLQADVIEQTLAAIVQGADGDAFAEAALFTSFAPREVRGMLKACFTFDVSAVPTDWESIYAETEKRYGENSARVVAALHADADFLESLNWAPSHTVDPEDKLGKIWFDLQGYRTDILKSNFMIVNSALQKVASLAFKANLGDKNKWPGTKEDAIFHIGRVVNRCKEAVAKTGVMDPAIEKTAAQLAAYWGAVIRRVQAAYTARKAELRVLDFNDLETLTWELLTDPAVGSRYRGAEFNHLLVDEFQDTNRAQQAIVYALSGLDRPGSLFVVGDPKQSIYRFRGAQNEVFDAVRRQIEAAGGKRLSLSMSFRTHARLVTEINRFFAPLIPGYEPMAAARTADGYDQPTIEITAIAGDQLPDSADTVEDLRRHEALALAQRIQAIVAEGWSIWDKADNIRRPVAFGDFAVLIRSYRLMIPIEDAFKAAQIPYVTVAGRGFFKQQEVTDLRNLLSALYNHADNLALAVALRSPLFNLSDDALFGLRLAERDYPLLWDAVQHLPDSEAFAVFEPIDADAIRFARECLTQMALLAGRARVAELLTVALEQTAYLAALAGLPDGDRKVNNALKFMDVARSSDRVALGDFTRYIDELHAAEAREGEAVLESEGTVQIMTVHAAKGLEFPVVCLFDTADNGGPPDTALVKWNATYGLASKVPKVEPGSESKSRYDKPFAFHAIESADAEADAQEQIRLLYVAMTRAQDYVLISGCYKKHVSAKSWFGLLTAHYRLPADPPESVGVYADAVRYTLYRPRPDAEAGSGDERPTGQVQGGIAGRTGWVRLETQPAAPLAPRLLAPLHAPPGTVGRTLNAADLPHLIRDPANFRQHVLFGAPLQSRETRPGPLTPSADQRMIGQIVHEVLQWPGFEQDLRAKVAAAAWEYGLTDTAVHAQAVAEALTLVEQTLASPLWSQIRAARETFREYPFFYRAAGHLISGKIDLLFRGANGGWTIVDFKTEAVREGQFYKRAERYWLQLGVYAAAVRAAVGAAPRVLIHFVRADQTIPVTEAQWRGALAALNDHLLAAFRDDTGDSGPGP